MKLGILFFIKIDILIIFDNFKLLIKYKKTRNLNINIIKYIKLRK